MLIESVSIVVKLQNELKFIAVGLIELDLKVLKSSPFDKTLLNNQNSKTMSSSDYSDIKISSKDLRLGFFLINELTIYWLFDT